MASLKTNRIEKKNAIRTGCEKGKEKKKKKKKKSWNGHYIEGGLWNAHTKRKKGPKRKKKLEQTLLSELRSIQEDYNQISQ